MRYEDRRRLVHDLQKSVLNIDTGSVLGECESGRYISDRKAFETYDDSTKKAIHKRNAKLGADVKKVQQERAKAVKTELALSELYKQRRKDRKK